MVTEAEILYALASGPLSTTEIVRMTGGEIDHTHQLLNQMLDQNLVWPVGNNGSILRKLTLAGSVRLAQHRRMVDAITPDSAEGQILVAILEFGRKHRRAPASEALRRQTAIDPQTFMMATSRLKHNGLVRDSGFFESAVITWTHTSIGRYCAERLQEQVSARA